MAKRKKKILLLFLTLLTLFSVRVNALENTYTPSELSRYGSYEYVIDAYDVNIVVNENNTLDITETITANFNTAKHGIIRRIPLQNTVDRLDGTVEKNRAQLTNLTVDSPYTMTTSNGNYVIQIGDANRTIKGEKTYVIKYTYNLGKDKNNSYDELYYNIIGSDWDTVIGNVTFTVKMPKEFDATKLGFSSGKVGSIRNENVEYTVDNLTITGSYHGILNSGEALTVRCELENGYFVNAKLNVNPTTYLMFAIPLISLIIAGILWFLKGRDETPVETVEFYPPEGFNSLEIGYLYKGKADKKDVTSLLVYLANKGYIKISEIEEHALFSKSTSFKITKLKDYDGTNSNERIFMEGLFLLKDEVTKEDLQNRFYTTMNEILRNTNNKENKNQIFEKNTYIKPLMIILMIVTIIATVAAPTLEYGNISTLVFTLFLCGFYLMFYLAGIFAIPSLGVKIFWIGFTFIHSFMFFQGLPIATAMKNDVTFLVGVLIGIISLIGLIAIFKIIPKRTKYGTEILGKIKGFKNFLETAEKERLEALVMEHPTYFYDILPYTYVLGISDKWIKKFESIATEPPTWYDSPSAFDMVVFTSFMNTTMTSATHAMTQSPSSGGGYGGSSGGGSSGGGSGGGGGSSW